MTRYIFAAFFSALLLLGSAAANAGQGIRIGEDRARLDVGYFLPSFKTSARVDSPTLGVGDELDFENDLFLDERVHGFRLEGYLRLAARQRWQFGFYDLTRSTKTDINEELQVGDTIFPIDTRVLLNFDTSVTETGYLFSVFKNRALELSTGVGIAVISTNISLSDSTGNLSETASASGFLPVFSANAAFALSKEVGITAQGRVVALEADTYSGSLTELRVTLDFYPHQYLGFGLGYDFFHLDAEVNEEDYIGRLNFRHKGLLLFTIVHF